MEAQLFCDLIRVESGHLSPGLKGINGFYGASLWNADTGILAWVLALG